MEKAELIWMNGDFVPWDEAKVHVLSHGLHYGTGVFEGIRCYETERGPAIFRHRDHLAATGCGAATSARSRFGATARWGCTRRALPST
jgi:branched-subunit amino acid aminotransferase/4-amino-4-deoxychorismate lyase